MSTEFTPSSNLRANVPARATLTQTAKGEAMFSTPPREEDSMLSLAHGTIEKLQLEVMQSNQCRSKSEALLATASSETIALRSKVRSLLHSEESLRRSDTLKQRQLEVLEATLCGLKQRQNELQAGLLAADRTRGTPQNSQGGQGSKGGEDEQGAHADQNARDDGPLRVESSTLAQALREADSHTADLQRRYALAERATRDATREATRLRAEELEQARAASAEMEQAAQRAQQTEAELRQQLAKAAATHADDQAAVSAARLAANDAEGRLSALLGQLEMSLPTTQQSLARLDQGAEEADTTLIEKAHDAGAAAGRYASALAAAELAAREAQETVRRQAKELEQARAERDASSREATDAARRLDAAERLADVLERRVALEHREKMEAQDVTTAMREGLARSSTSIKESRDTSAQQQELAERRAAVAEMRVDAAKEAVASMQREVAAARHSAQQELTWEQRRHGAVVDALRAELMVLEAALERVFAAGVPAGAQDAQVLGNWQLLADRAECVVEGAPPPTARVGLLSNPGQIGEQESASTILKDACRMLLVQSHRDLKPVLGEVVRVAVTVPELERLIGIVRVAWAFAHSEYGGCPSHDELPRIDALEGLMRQWANEHRRAKLRAKRVQDEYARFRTEVGAMCGVSSTECEGSNLEMLLAKIRMRLEVALHAAPPAPSMGQ
tara:strand:- start:103 stop:2139 length:2037 start_codon:yes stop_codon:yes gene_type:complete